MNPKTPNYKVTVLFRRTLNPKPLNPINPKLNRVLFHLFLLRGTLQDAWQSPPSCWEGLWVARLQAVELGPRKST